MAQESRLIAFEQALKDEGIKGTNLEPVARSIFQQESSSGANVKTSNAGARGPMQVLPATFKAYNPQGNIDNPYDNSVGGLRYIKDLFNKTGDLGLTAVGYYGGPKAIEKAKQGVAVSDPRNPNAPNTLQYMEQVMGRTQGAPAGKQQRPAVPKTIKQVAPELGPNYQAALALMAKADDLSEAREKIAEEEELASAGADFSQARQMLAQIKPVTGFVAQEPRRMASGGSVDRFTQGQVPYLDSIDNATKMKFFTSPEYEAVKDIPDLYRYKVGPVLPPSLAQDKPVTSTTEIKIDPDKFARARAMSDTPNPTDAAFKQYLERVAPAPYGLAYGFKPPSGPAGQALTTWYNSRTGQRFTASTGGYTNENPEWTTDPYRSYIPPSNPSDFLQPAKGYGPQDDKGYQEYLKTAGPNPLPYISWSSNNVAPRAPNNPPVPDIFNTIYSPRRYLTYTPPPMGPVARSPVMKRYNNTANYNFFTRFMADGGFVSIPNIQTPILSSKDKAKRTELETQLKKYDADIKSYNEALEKYNTEIYNPYKIKTEEYNAAADAYNKAVEAARNAPEQIIATRVVYGPAWLRGGYIPYGARGPEERRDMPTGGMFRENSAYRVGGVGDIYIPGAPMPDPFTLTAPTAPDPFNMTAPTAPTTQEEIDKFITQAQAQAQRNAQGRQIARSAVQDPNRFNFGSVALGDLSGFGGTSTQLFAEGGEAKKESPSMGESVKGTAKEILRSMQYTPYDLLGAPVDVINLGLKGVDYVTGSKLATDKPVGGSDYLIQKSRELGIADQPTGSTTETLTRLGTGIVSPTAGPRAVVAAGKAAKGTAKAALEDLAMAGTGQGGSKLAQKIMEPGTAFAVRPKGGVYLGAKSVDDPVLSRSDVELKNLIGGIDTSTEQGTAIKEFFDKKARNFIQNQYGTADDPVFKKILEGRIPPGQFYISPERMRKYRETGDVKDARDAYDAETNVLGLLSENVSKQLGGGYSYKHQTKVEQDIKNLIAQQTPNNPTTTMVQTRPINQKSLEDYPNLYDFPGIKQLIEEGNKSGIASILNKTDLPPHIRQAIKQGDPVYTNQVSLHSLRLNDLKDYLSTRSPSEIKNMGFADALAKSSEWHEMLANASKNPNKFSRKELFAGTEPIKKLEGDYSWVDVKTKEALALEGCIMGHCVGRLPSYAEGVLNGTKKIYSLRDKKGIPHVTVEINKTNEVPMYNWDGSVRKEVDPSKKDVFNQIAQIKGKANTPAENYFPQINEFLTDYSNKIGEQPQITELPKYVPENWRNK
jgi:hypothetical protein